ncbi:MAG TPA: hypothetical protein VL330_05860, partial [Actinomycetes bacterium]|nr:hypothetical protein [Actinomycetes bacterium]
LSGFWFLIERGTVVYALHRRLGPVTQPALHALKSWSEHAVARRQRPSTLDYAESVSKEEPSEVLKLGVALGFAPYLLMLGCGLACLSALLLRFRRARGVERQQLKWLLFACAVTIAIFLVVQPNTASSWQLGLLLTLPFFLAVPVAAGVAILRYRLYEIDRIINRTLVYGLLTAILGLCYAAGSLLFALIAGAGSDPPSWLVAAATLAAAAVFRPIRNRIQAAVDRRFNRRRYQAARIVEAFSTRLRDQVDLDSLSAELMAVADHTMEPTMLSLWLRPSTERSQRSRH